ncbi:MAG: VIT and VWA domain-containing protein, partial [Chitinivibrionales bacterium]|nr:VIT and VWA domain-containing protein [Chitinivibrionales bacterium]
MQYVSMVLAALVLFSAQVFATAIPNDSIGEGACAGYIPVAADTMRDTSFHYGDTLVMPSGDRVYKPWPAERRQYAMPSVKTTVAIVAGDGFAGGTVTQIFRNPFALPFEATYIFPLPHNGAVHSMKFRTQNSVYSAVLKEKEQAQQEYQQALQDGRMASLLLQGQDNIFMQKICNIPPHDSVQITIEFSMSLSYDKGTYELAFPTTMIPRYDPPALGKRLSNPSYLPPNTRSGTTLDFSVLILTPYDIDSLQCPSHPVVFENGDVTATSRALGLLDASSDFPLNSLQNLVRLSAQNEVPNRDIVVRFKRRPEARSLSALSYHDGANGYFAVQIYPTLADTAGKPKSVDMVFVIDKSGSMDGAPLAKAKEIMGCMLDKAQATDRISFLAFSDYSVTLFPTPVAATTANLAGARTWIANLSAGGGTEMLSAVRQALAVPLDDSRTRIIVLLTDGAIGGVNDIYQAIRNAPGYTTVFTFGIGSSPNRELIDGAATAGNGIGTNVLLTDAAQPVVDNFFGRIRMPQVRNLRLTWDGADINSLTKDTLGNLWAGQPIALFGRYSSCGARTITLSGLAAGAPVSETYTVDFVQNNTVLKSVKYLWARNMIEKLVNQQVAAGTEQNKNAILNYSLANSVLCQYTAFIAVADSQTNSDGRMVAAAVPLQLPEGVNPVMAGANVVSSPTQYGTPVETPLRPQTSAAPMLLAFSMHPRSIDFKISSLKWNAINVSENATNFIGVYDLNGRLIFRWSLVELAARGFSWSWDFKSL